MTGDASPRWAPTIGAAVGACVVILNAALLAAGDADRTVPATVLGLALLCPLVGRWPLSRVRVLAIALGWFCLGVVLALVGGGYVALAAVPALIGALVGWGTRAR